MWQAMSIYFIMSLNLVHVLFTHPVPLSCSEVKGRKKQGETKQKSTKILVRNIPFEAKKREIEELFK